MPQAIARLFTLSLTGLVAMASSLPVSGETRLKPFRKSIESGDASAAAQLARLYGVVTSTHRSPERNRLVGGVPNSHHLTGRAIDIARARGVTHRQVEAALRSAGYHLIESLDEGDHSHFAFAPAAVKMAGAVSSRGGVKQGESDPLAPVEDAVPAVKVRPQLAADDHGTLIADLVAKAVHPAEPNTPASIP